MHQQNDLEQGAVVRQEKDLKREALAAGLDFRQERPGILQNFATRQPELELEFLSFQENAEEKR